MRKRYDESKITPEMKQLLRDTAIGDRRQRETAMYRLVSELQDQLRKGIFWGDILEDIYTVNRFEPGVSREYPLDPIAPGTEKDFVAYTIPKTGTLPNRMIEGDYIMVPTYVVGNGIDWSEKYARDARWDVVARAMEVLEAGLVKKRNDDGWHLLLGAAVDRNIMVYDNAAPQGHFTKKLVSLMKVIMRRNGGGNSTSVNRFKLTDIYISPEGCEDIRNWNLDQVDEFTRRDIFLNEDAIDRIFNVNIHPIDELGQSQEYQNFFLNDLGGALAVNNGASDLELVVGLDLDTLDAFKNPVVEDIRIEPDDSQRRARRQSVWAEREYGFAITDSRPVLLASY